MSEPEVESIVEGAVEDTGEDVWTQVSMVAHPQGCGARVRQVPIGDGYPAVLIQLKEEVIGGEPCVLLNVTAGGLGFTDYQGSVDSVVAVLQNAIDGLLDPDLLGTARTLTPSAHFAPDLPPDPEREERERAAYLALLDEDDDE